MGHIWARKAITNLNSILKSRDISLPTKIHIVKDVVFLVVMQADEQTVITQLSRP